MLDAKLIFGHLELSRKGSSINHVNMEGGEGQPKIHITYLVKVGGCQNSNINLDRVCVTSLINRFSEI